MHEQENARKWVFYAVEYFCSGQVWNLVKCFGPFRDLERKPFFRKKRGSFVKIYSNSSDSNLSFKFETKSHKILDQGVIFAP